MVCDGCGCGWCTSLGLPSATLATAEAGASAGAAIAGSEVVSVRGGVVGSGDRRLTAGDGESGEDELGEVHHL